MSTVKLSKTEAEYVQKALNAMKNIENDAEICITQSSSSGIGLSTVVIAIFKSSTDTITVDCTDYSVW